LSLIWARIKLISTTLM